MLAHHHRLLFNNKAIHSKNTKMISQTKRDNFKRSSSATSAQLKLISLSVAVIFSCALQVDPVYGAFENGNNNNVKITEHGLELTQAINIQRQEHLQKQCELLGYHTQTLDDLTEQQLSHLILDREHKLLYCYVPKVACTNWKRMLMMLTGKWNGTDPLQIPASLAHSIPMFDKFDALSEEERIQAVSEYTRVIFVRHPFERLLSAYRNKFQGDTESARYFRSHVGRQIVKAFRVKATNHSLEHADDVSFAELVQYLLTPEVSRINATYNEHWAPIMDLCSPCVIKYNVVGKYETLLDDSALALHLSGAHNLTFPNGSKPSNTRAHLRTYFDPLSISAIRRLYEFYADDFRLFDYGLDDILGFEFA